VLDEGRDAISLADAQLGEGVGQAVGLPLHLGSRELGAGHVEVLAVGIGLEPLLEQRGHGVLLVADPDVGPHGDQPRTAGMTTSASRRRFSHAGSGGRPPHSGWVVTPLTSPERQRSMSSSRLHTTYTSLLRISSTVAELSRTADV